MDAIHPLGKPRGILACFGKTFIEQMKQSLGLRAKGRKIIGADDTFELREVLTPYGKAHAL
jgi:hypothetical protein